ncbi:MAG TPA: hypothetical protein VGM11_12765, partial [Acidobacteriaceae bacterium]
MANRMRFTDASDWGCDMCGRDSARRNGVTRRGFLRGGALALVGTSVVPAFLTRAIYAEVDRAATSRKKLVVIFQRGACDGLNVVVPHAEKNYYRMRPTIAIQKNDVVDLDGFFGLHPATSAMKPLYDQGHLAIVHAAGSPDPSRSHFDAQDFMESGTPGVKSTPDGWLNRALQVEPVTGTPSPFRAVALNPELPRTLEGKVPAV